MFDKRKQLEGFSKEPEALAESLQSATILVGGATIYWFVFAGFKIPEMSEVFNLLALSFVVLLFISSMLRGRANAYRKVEKNYINRKKELDAALETSPQEKPDFYLKEKSTLIEPETKGKVLSFPGKKRE